MTWRTHVAIGTNAIWLTVLFGRIDQSIVVLLPVAALASLLPDIDAVDAKIHYAAGGVLGIFKNSFHGKYFHHRGMMHSILVMLIFFAILTIFFYNLYPLLPAVFALSYFSHSFIDGFNTSVGYLYPFNRKRFALLPRSLLTPVGGAADNLLLFLGLFGLLVYFALFAVNFIPTHSLVF